MPSCRLREQPVSSTTHSRTAKSVSTAELAAYSVARTSPISADLALERGASCRRASSWPSRPRSGRSGPSARRSARSRSGRPCAARRRAGRRRTRRPARAPGRADESTPSPCDEFALPPECRYSCCSWAMRRRPGVELAPALAEHVDADRRCPVRRLVVLLEEAVEPAQLPAVDGTPARGAAVVAGLPGQSTGAQSMWNQGPITSFCGCPDGGSARRSSCTSPPRNASYQPPMCSAGTRMRVVVGVDADSAASTSS